MKKFTMEHKPRIVALSILGVLVLIAWMMFIQPVVNAFIEQRQQISSARERLLAYHIILSRRPVLQSELSELQKLNASATGLVEGTNASLAAASMQGQIRTIIEESGGVIRSTQNLTPSVKDNLEKIEIQCDLTLPLNKMSEVIYKLETHTPYFFLDKASLSMPDGWQPQSTSDSAPPLQVRWIIRGYRWVST